MYLRVTTGIVGGLLLATIDVRAEVFCKRRSGAVVVRDACKKKETAIDLAQFGAV